MANGADYTILVADLVSGTIREEIPFDTFTYGHSLNAAGSFSGTISTRHPKATRENLDPSRTVVYVLRNGVCMWSGILWTAQADIGQSDQVLVGGEGFWSYFAGPGGQTSQGRFLKADAYPSVVPASVADQLTFAQALITWAQAQPGGDLGIVVGSETSGIDVSVNLLATQRANIGQVILTLAQADGGFDFSIDTDFSSGSPVTTLHTWFPMQGRRVTDLVLELGVNITELQWQIDGTTQANSVDMVGQGGVFGTVPIGSAVDTSQLDSYPLLETVQQAKSSADFDTLGSLAATYLASVDVPVETLPMLMSRVTADIAPGVWTMGDWIEVRARDGYVDLDEMFRVIGDQTTVDAQGSEQVQLTFAQASAFL